MADPNVQYQLVTGNWAHVDGDQLVRPDGFLSFSPDPEGLLPHWATTIGSVRALVDAGVLRDIQDRAGVYLAAFVDGVPIRWTAEVHKLEWKGEPVATGGPVTFDPNLDGVNLTALF